ncbi:phosphotransferase [Shimia sp. CNT1-13L.2]|uniref:aminoglycoside phosphotransferase family protein n=1 Tax=Shimia sp. CNT1-13L.2 TaxID=2959663 RepID=UPI0020CF1E70|nr:phosphotransferase [Shimia sp. CNT1-13L.2]MCP9482633.1 phosphotransferase [Shimia sp. CNT1-13L.2]
MSDRDTLIDKFIATTDWKTAKVGPLAGDASNRRYLRLEMNGETAVLMDAPPEKGEDVRPFVKIDTYLCDLGLSAPRVLASDPTNGFLLLEDLGDDLFARVMERSPELETPLYETATDVLVDLHKHAAPDDLKTYTPEFMAEMAALAYRWYLRGLDMPYEDKATRFQTHFRSVLENHANEAEVLIQRDYHAENLLWLPDRSASARVGLLDFQDALVGHRAYDLVSLLQDARRDVPAQIETQMISRYLDATGMVEQDFQTAYHVLGAQRNLRIIGVFARLSMHFGKPHYIDLIPRVWTYLLRDLTNPALAETKGLLLDDLPEPTPDLLKKLKEKCATIPTL